MKKGIFVCFLFLIFIGVSLKSIAQNKSNKGKEFWLGYGHNIIMTPGSFSEVVNSQEQTVYISTDAPANVTVSINGTSWSQTLLIPANSVNASILIPKTGINDARLLAEGLSTKGIHIVSDTPVVVYAHQYATQSSAATMLMPVETWGYNYSSLNFYQVSNYANSFSWFYVIATEDNTKINIKPADTTAGGWLPSQTYTINLNKGEIYNVFGKQISSLNGKDMTGSKVTSVQGADGNCHPITLFCGSSRNVLLSPNCTFTYTGVSGPVIANGHGGEILFQQMFPSNAWGTRYLTYHCINNTSNDLILPYKNLYRVVVKDPTTIVKRNGVILNGLINNFFYEFVSTSGDYIEANKPILMAQYLINSNQCMVPVPVPNPLPGNGDPEMIFLSPIEQGLKSTLFFAARRTNAIGLVYVNVIVPTTGLSSMLIDGTPIDSWEYIPHPNYPSYSVVARRFLGPEGKHTITCDSVFTAINYGLGDYESYGYNAGCLVNNLDGYGGIKNSNNSTLQTDTFTCPNTPLKLLVKLAYPATSITWKLSQVSGISPNVDLVDNAPIQSSTELINGRTYYIYALPQDHTFATVGSYNIPVTYTANGIDACNSTDNINFNVVVKPGPTANFTFPNACPNQTITLTGTSISNGFTLTNYLWNFPDATTQNTLNSTKAFAAIGSYNVRYRIYASNGCVGDTTKQIVIGSPLTAVVTGAGKACADSTFTFTSSIVQDASNTRTWHWDFGDGTPTVSTTTNTVTHSFSSSNVTRTLKHAVSFAVGCNTDTASFTVPIIAPNPIANFSILKDTLCAGRAFAFTSTNTNINTWLWNFGNGTSNQTPPFTHNYLQAGIYNVQLMVKDNNGCGSLPATDVMNINPIPLVNAGQDVFVNPGNSILLQASVSPTANYNYLWSPAATLSAVNILQPVASPIVSTTYYLVVKNPVTLCVSSDSVNVRIISKLYIPNAFSPLSNSKNKVWRIPGIEQYPNSMVLLYNRYGQKIYETTNNATNPWDGKYKSVDQPSGVYVYIIHLNNNSNEVLKGTVLLIR